MTDLESRIRSLWEPDQTAAYACFQALREESRRSDMLYPFFRLFAEMLDSGNSYVRTRGLLLIAANARWDKDHKVDEIIDRYLSHIMDEKPTVARQVIGALPELARYKPELAGDIRGALKRANPGKYPNSMAPLIQSDIARALDQIQALQ